MLKVQEIREIIKLIDESSIHEFTYETDGSKIEMKKIGETVAVQAAPQVVAPAITPVQENVAEITNEHTNDKAAKESVTVTEQSAEKTSASDYDYEIVSPMVGTFYSSPNPESDAYVKVGSKVDPDTVVCIVEAMKLFNEIEAEKSGEIVEVLADNGELVEYGQPLFRVKTK